ncbi:MAG: serine hydrolase domain-containing protein [Bacteroidota bacterium]
MVVRGLFFLLLIMLTSLLVDGLNKSSLAVANLQVAGSLTGEELRILKHDELEEMFSFLHRKRRFNGAVLVAQKGVVLYEEAFGWANRRRKDSLHLHSAFQLASVSKIFTGAAVMLLQQEGKLNLDDELSLHLKGWPYEGMTIRHLLQHRSGLARYMAVASWYWKKVGVDMTNQDVLRQYVRHKPVHFFTPGRGFNYCNTNYVILAQLVEEVSGLPFDRFMKERMFQPLGMADAMIYSRKTDPEIPQEAIGYKAGWKGYYKAPNDYIDGVWGDKNMYASVRDLWQFEQGLRERALLTEESIAEIFTPGSPRRRNNYGLGWRMKVGEDPIYYHFGWWRGFRSCYLRDVKRELTIIILSNQDHPGLNLRYWDVYKRILALGYATGEEVD